jgi:hypothetical protein
MLWTNHYRDTHQPNWEEVRRRHPNVPQYNVTLDMIEKSNNIPLDVTRTIEQNLQGDDKSTKSASPSPSPAK